MSEEGKRCLIPIEDINVVRAVDAVLIPTFLDVKIDITKVVRNGGVERCNEDYALQIVNTSDIPTIEMLGTQFTRLTPIRKDSITRRNGILSNETGKIETYTNSWPKYGSAVHFIPKTGRYFHLLEKGEIACFWTKNVTGKLHDRQYHAFETMQEQLRSDYPHLVRRFKMVALQELPEWTELKASPSELTETMYFSALLKLLHDFIDQNRDVRSIHLWIQGEATFKVMRVMDTKGLANKYGKNQSELSEFLHKEAMTVIEQGTSLSNPINTFLKPFKFANRIMDGDVLLRRDYEFIEFIYALAVKDVTQPEINSDSHWWDFKELKYTTQMFKAFKNEANARSYHTYVVEMMKDWNERFEDDALDHKDDFTLEVIDIDYFLAMSFFSRYTKHRDITDNSVVFWNCSSKTATWLQNCGLKIGCVVIIDDETHRYNMYERSKDNTKQPAAESARTQNIMDLLIWSRNQRDHETGEILPSIKNVSNFYDSLEFAEKFGPIVLSPSASGKSEFVKTMRMTNSLEYHRHHENLEKTSWMAYHNDVTKTPSLSTFRMNLQNRSRSNKPMGLYETAFSTTAILRSMFISPRDLLLRFELSDIKDFDGSDNTFGLGVVEAIEPATSIVDGLRKKLMGEDQTLLNTIESALSMIFTLRQYTPLHTSSNVFLVPITLGEIIVNYTGDWVYAFDFTYGFRAVSVTRSNVRREGNDNAKAVFRDIESLLKRVSNAYELFSRFAHVDHTSTLFFYAKHKIPTPGSAGLTAMSFRTMFRYGRNINAYKLHKKLQTLNASGHAMAALLMPRCIFLTYLSEILFLNASSPFSFPTNEPVREGSFHTKDEYLAAIRFASHAYSLNGSAGRYLEIRLTLFRAICEVI